MEIIAALGGGAFVLTSLVTGIRLVVMSGRTRQLPELILGLGLLLMGGLGYPLTMLGEFGTFLSDGARAVLVASNQLCGVVGLSLLGAFTRKVFRPADRLAAAAVYASAAAYAGAFVWRAMTYGFTPLELGGELPPLVHLVLTCVTLSWSGSESLVYHLRLRKRLRLGLADPIVADRFRLWAIGMLVAMLLSAVSSLCGTLGIPFNTSTPGILTVGVLGSTCAASIWCAFFPPAAYVRWVRARTAARFSATA